MAKDQRLRILQIVRAPAGGIRRHVVALLEGFEKAGHEVWLVTQVDDGDHKFREFLAAKPKWRERIIDLQIRDLPGPWDLVMIWKLRQALRERKFDVVHGHGAKGGLLARLVGRTMGAKTVYTPHGGALHAMHGRIKNKVYAWVERALLSFTDLLLFESEYSKTQYFEKVSRAESKTRVNPNGVPETRFALEPWPKEIGTVSRPVQIGAFGLLRRLKGFDILLQAVRMLSDQGIRVNVLISGAGPEKENLEVLIAELGLESCVEMPGEAVDVEARMRGCDIVVQPSRFESFGLVALEAQAVGTAVIASRVGGLMEVIENGVTGRLVMPEDAVELAATIRQMLDEPEATLRMRRAAVESARTRFSEGQMIEGARLAYLDLMRRTEDQ